MSSPPLVPPTGTPMTGANSLRNVMQGVADVARMAANTVLRGGAGGLGSAGGVVGGGGLTLDFGSERMVYGVLLEDLYACGSAEFKVLVAQDTPDIDAQCTETWIVYDGLGVVYNSVLQSPNGDIDNPFIPAGSTLWCGTCLTRRSGWR